MEMQRLRELSTIQASHNKCSKPLLVIATCCAMMFAASAQAAYDVTIAVSGSSSGGSWVANTWTPNASGSTVLASEIATRVSSGPTVISTAGAGADNGDIFVNSAVSWSANQLTLVSARNININANLNGSGTATLYLQYGFGTGAGGYYLGNAAQVNLPAGNNFSTQLNATGLVTYTVITSLGVEGDATVAPGTMTLQGMRTGLAGKYALGANIAASGTSTWNANLGFTPVGDSVSNFTGTFDGLGHTISGLTIARGNYTGLFGVNGGTIRNVGLLNSSVAGWGEVGALVGQSSGAISNSYADGGSVTGGGTSVGGLVGGNIAASSVSNSYATVSVSGNSAVGGLAGAGGDISNSYATGAVAGTSSVGGLVGHSVGDISNSYATGPVTGTSSVGGLVGHSGGNIISNSYATGAVTGTSYVGGLVGDNYSGTAINSYWDSATTGRASTGGCSNIPFMCGTATSLTDITAAPYAQASYAGLNFSTIWSIYAGHTYPLLKSFLTPLTVTANAASKAYDGLAYSGGNGVSYSVTPNANLLGTVSYGGTSQGAINVGSYTIIPSGYWSNQQGYDIIAYVNGTLSILPVSYTGTIATGGSATATVSGGGAGCGFTATQFVPVVNPPAGVTFPYGLFNFTLSGCTPGSTVALNITYPGAVPAGTQYWKYGPTPDNHTSHWYIIPATIAGNTMTFSITDGGLGDDDYTANGTIVDAGGPGLVTPIPTLSEWGMILLAGMLGVFGVAGLRWRE
jgi:hypothetical protein